MRRDAAANRERVLAAAAVAVKRDGERVPIATIATAAGVGVGTVYRHFATREDLLVALTNRSFEHVLDRALEAMRSKKPAIECVGDFLERTIESREDLILPLHGGPVIPNEKTVSLRAEIRSALSEVLRRGRLEGNIRADAEALDVIITGAVLAQPLPHVSNWDRVARRQAAIYLTGLSATAAPRLPARG